MPIGTAAAAPDDTAFAAFLQAALPVLRTFVGRLCAGGLDPDDVLQETLAKVWRLRHAFDPGRNGLAWLHQAAFRTFCDLRRIARRLPAGTDATTAPAPARACPTETHDELQQRLAALPALERELLLGFHRDGLTLRELAGRHRLPLNTVKSHLHRARRRLHADHGDPR